MNLNAKALGLAGGIFWSIMLFLMTVLSIYTGYAAAFLKVIAGIYPGYGITWPGAFLGIIYGFIDGFVGGYLLAWLYNKIGK